MQSVYGLAYYVSWFLVQRTKTLWPKTQRPCFTNGTSDRSWVLNIFEDDLIILWIDQNLENLTLENGISSSSKWKWRANLWASEKGDGLVNGINESYKSRKEVEKEAYNKGDGITSFQSPTTFKLNPLDDEINLSHRLENLASYWFFFSIQFFIH